MSDIQQYASGDGDNGEPTRAQCRWITLHDHEDLLRQRDERIAELEKAIEELRDGVLNERGPMAEMGFTNDQVNSVLGVIDDAVGSLLSAPVTDDDRELRILKSKDALLWLEESSLNMRRRLEGKGEPEIARQSDITALYIKSLLESALLAARKGAAS